MRAFYASQFKSSPGGTKSWYNPDALLTPYRAGGTKYLIPGFFPVRVFKWNGSSFRFGDAKPSNCTSGETFFLVAYDWVGSLYGVLAKLPI